MSGKSFLVVDDSATFRHLLCMSLATIEGVTESSITQAVDGEDALKKMRQGSFDLVFSDIRMPNMDGLELLRRLRDEPVCKETPVIIISTKGSEDDIERGLSLGAAGYLSKPISMTKLRELLAECLPREEYKNGTQR